MCVGYVFSIFPFWAFYFWARCGECGVAAEKKKNGHVFELEIGKEDEKKKRTRKREGKISMAHLKQESG